MKLEIELSWPAKELSPNARVHWAVKAKKTAAYRQEAMIATRNKMDYGKIPSERLHLFITYFQPDKRSRDEDNLLSSLKPAMDGIAYALGVNDKLFRSHPFVSDEIVKGGMVQIVITEDPEESAK